MGEIGPGGEIKGSDCLMSKEFWFGINERVLEMEGGDVCTTVSVLVMPLNCTLTNG